MLDYGAEILTSLVALGWLGAMEDSTLPEFRYASFMLRIWREVNGEVEGDARGWLGEIEHLQSGQHGWFETLDDLPDLIRRQVETAVPG